MRGFTEVFDSLIDEYAAWQKASGLNIGSADEHLFDESLTPEQRKWLSSFVIRWDEAERDEQNFFKASA